MGVTRIRLAKRINSSRLSSIFGIPLNKIPNITASYACTNSKFCRRNDIFFALCGDLQKARKHVQEAQSKGALAIGPGGSISGIAPASALLTLAADMRCSLPSLVSTIAITGSVGKTTTKEFLHTILSTLHRCHATSGNQNNEIGVPLTILSAQKNTEIIILECGMNHRGELSELSKCARPDLAVITNIGSAHIGNFGSREAIAAAKLEILEGAAEGAALIRPASEILLESDIRRDITFSSSDTSADYLLSPYNGSIDLLELHTPCGKCVLRNPGVKATHLLPNLAAAIAVAHTVGLTVPEIATGVSWIAEKSMRHKIIRCKYYTVLDDSYNCSYESACSALKHLKKVATGCASALLGDILELGELSAQIHKSLGAHAASLGIDKLYLLGAYSEQIMQGAVEGGMPEERIFIFDRKDNFATIAKILKNKITENETVLIKASHACALWKITDLLTEDK